MGLLLSTDATTSTGQGSIQPLGSLARSQPVTTSAAAQHQKSRQEHAGPPPASLARLRGVEHTNEQKNAVVRPAHRMYTGDNTYRICLQKK